MSDSSTDDGMVVQRPLVEADELFLLFHGVGSDAQALLPLGQALAAAFPRAWVVSVQAPHACDLGRGWQWFSVQGVTEANRTARVATAMPAFAHAVAEWQRASGIDAGATTLVGFSQGAIMSLEATQLPRPIAARTVAIAGRFAQAPRVASSSRVHLMHGEQDPVMPIVLAVQAQQQLQALGTAATLDRFPGLGHGIDARVVQKLIERLKNPDTAHGSQ